MPPCPDCNGKRQLAKGKATCFHCHVSSLSVNIPGYMRAANDGQVAEISADIKTTVASDPDRYASNKRWV